MLQTRFFASRVAAHRGDENLPQRRGVPRSAWRNYHLQSRDPRVCIAALTHSHVPMAHGGYATT